MGDNRPTVGYIVVDRINGAQSWSANERRLCTSSSAEVFPHLPAARRALNDTIVFARRHGYGWQVSQYMIVRVVRPRRPRG
jgi:hypothetical protein